MSPLPWYRILNRYHWWILIVAALGWLFDTMDQRLFLLARKPAMKELLGASALDADVTYYSGIATAVFLIGWATGGLIFGVLGDRWGRARTMLLTILIYSFCTGLSALSQHWWDFTIYRFFTGLGVGGEFAAGVALVAEVMPAAARPQALGFLQSLSVVGNIGGSMISFALLPNWRWMFVCGIAPALLVVAVRRKLKEPDSWREARAAEAVGEAPASGSIPELLSDRRWRRHTVIGVLLALAGVVGLWGVGFWTPELTGYVVEQEHRPRLVEQFSVDEPRVAQELASIKGRVASTMTALQDVGAFFGISLFTYLAARMGRRWAFAAAYTLALAATLIVFGGMRSQSQVWWMGPLLGFANLSVFGGFAIYFPELFPTRLRSTGTGFCYNVARYLAAAAPFTLGYLQGAFHEAGFTEPFRAAAITVSMLYLLGLAVLPFAPETKGQPLPT